MAQRRHPARNRAGGTMQKTQEGKNTGHFLACCRPKGRQLQLELGASLEVEQAARSEPGKEGAPHDQQRLIFEAEQEHADGDMQAKVQVEAAGMQPDQQSRICASERHADQQCLTIAGKRLELEGMLAWEDVAEGTGEEGIPPDQQGLTAAVKQLDVDEKGIPPDQQGLTMAGQRLELEEMLAHADRQLAEGIRPNQQRAIFEGDQLQSKKVIPPDQQGLSFAGEQLEADRILNIAGKQPKLEEMLAYADMRLVEDVQPNLQRIIVVGEQLQQKKAKEGIPPDINAGSQLEEEGNIDDPLARLEAILQKAEASVGTVAALAIFDSFGPGLPGCWRGHAARGAA